MSFLNPKKWLPRRTQRVQSDPELLKERPNRRNRAENAKRPAEWLAERYQELMQLEGDVVGRGEYADEGLEGEERVQFLRNCFGVSVVDESGGEEVGMLNGVRSMGALVGSGIWKWQTPDFIADDLVLCLFSFQFLQHIAGLSTCHLFISSCTRTLTL